MVSDWIPLLVAACLYYLDLNEKANSCNHLVGLSLCENQSAIHAVAVCVTCPLGRQIKGVILPS